MNKLIESIIEDWNFIRSQTKEFILNFNNEQIIKTLPRPGLNSYSKHFEEMIDVQLDYIDAIKSGKMEFTHTLENDEYLGKKTSDELLAAMDVADRALEEVLLSIDTDAYVSWPDEGDKNILSHLNNLCMHEAFHLGQITAFSYAGKDPIPDAVTTMWALSPQDES